MISKPLLAVAMIVIVGCGGGGGPTLQAGGLLDQTNETPNDPVIVPTGATSATPVRFQYTVDWYSAEGLRAFLALPSGVAEFTNNPVWRCHGNGTSGIAGADDFLFFRFRSGSDSGYVVDGVSGTAFVFAHTIDTDFELSSSFDFEFTGQDDAIFNNERWVFSDYAQLVVRFGADAPFVSYARTLNATVGDDQQVVSCELQCTGPIGLCTIERDELDSWLVPGSVPQ